MGSKYQLEIDRRNQNPQRYGTPTAIKRFAVYKNRVLVFTHDERRFILDFLSTVYSGTFKQAMENGYALVKEGELQFGKREDVPDSIR